MRNRFNRNVKSKPKILPNITRVDHKVIGRNVMKVDPSRTSALRRMVGAELRRRYMRLRKAILTMIRDRDTLGLKEIIRNAFNPLQARDEHGRWTSMGFADAPSPKYLEADARLNVAKENLNTVRGKLNDLTLSTKQ